MKRDVEQNEVKKLGSYEDVKKQKAEKRLHGIELKAVLIPSVGIGSRAADRGAGD